MPSEDLEAQLLAPKIHVAFARQLLTVTQMTDDPDRLERLVATTSGMRDILFAQTRLVDKCLHALTLHRDGKLKIPSGESEVFEVITTMTHMVGISGHSVLKLTDEVCLGVKDAYPIARSIVEGVINICFIMAEGAGTAAKARRHAEVKAYRDLRRDWEVGGFKMAVGHAGELPVEEQARLERMLPEFTTKRGGEKSWTDHTIKQRLERVAQRFPSTDMVSLNTSAFNIYRHASEVVHGSYFSARYFWGVTQPGRAAPQSREELELTLADHQFSILMSAIFALDGLVGCFSAYSGLADLNVDRKALLDRLAHLPSIKEALANE